jgi:hypothetical protein
VLAYFDEKLRNISREKSRGGLEADVWGDPYLPYYCSYGDECATDDEVLSEFDPGTLVWATISKGGPPRVKSLWTSVNESNVVACDEALRLRDEKPTSEIVAFAAHLYRREIDAMSGNFQAKRAIFESVLDKYVQDRSLRIHDKRKEKRERIKNIMDDDRTSK